MHRTATSLCSLLVVLLAAPASATAQDVAAVGPEVIAEATAAAATDVSPIAAVEALHAGLLDIMRRADALGFEGRYSTIRPVVGECFDLEFMSGKIVGRQWKNLAPDQQALWHDKFQAYLSANYAGNFNGFEGEHFETMGVEKAPRETVVVKTTLRVPASEDVVLNYRLREMDDGEWRIIDIYLRGTVSELALRRSDFSSILKDKGFPELTAALDRKIDDLREKGGG